MSDMVSRERPSLVQATTYQGPKGHRNRDEPVIRRRVFAHVERRRVSSSVGLLTTESKVVPVFL